MGEFFIRGSSFVVPTYSDSTEGNVAGTTVTAALLQFKKDYKHPEGLYVAYAYVNKAAYYTGKRPIAKWVSNVEKTIKGITNDLHLVKRTPFKPSVFTIGTKEHTVENPKEGEVILLVD